MAEALRQRRVTTAAVTDTQATRANASGVGTERALTFAIAGLIALPVAVGVVGVALPAFGILPALGGIEFSLAPFRALLNEPALVRSVLLSYATGLAATFVAVVGVALFVASFPGGRSVALVRPLLAPLLAVPHAAAAFALAFLIAPSGLIVRILAQPLGLSRPPDLLIVNDPLGLALLAGLVAKELPFLLLVAFAALPQVDPRRRLDLARSLGYGRVAGFLVAVWPSLYAQIRLPVLAVAAYSSSVVDVALILGPTTPPPLAVRLLRWTTDPDLSLRFQAAAGSILQIGVTAATLATWFGIERVGRRLHVHWSSNGRRWRRDGAVRWLAGCGVALSTLAVILGILLLALWSFAALWAFPALVPATLHLRTWDHALAAAVMPFGTTAALASVSALAALVLVTTLLEAHRRAAPPTATVRLTPTIAALLYLPLIVPQVAFVFGLQIIVQAAGLSPSFALVAAAHLVFVVPYLTLALAAPWYALDPRFERQAASLGHSAARRLFRIRLPMLAGPILTALAIGFATSVGQYLPTAVIGAGRFATVTTEAVALASGGNPRVVGAYALLQMVLPAAAFTLSGLAPLVLWRRRRGMRAWR